MLLQECTDLQRAMCNGGRGDQTENASWGCNWLPFRAPTPQAAKQTNQPALTSASILVSVRWRFSSVLMRNDTEVC